MVHALPLRPHKLPQARLHSRPRAALAPPPAPPSRTPRAPLAPEWPPSPRRRGVVPCSDFSYRLCVASLFRLHNETFNVWSELAPAVCFAVWTARFLD